MLNPAPAPEFEAVRDAVFTEWQRAETERFNEQFLNSLRTRYEIVIEGPDGFEQRVLEASDKIEVAIPDGETG